MRLSSKPPKRARAWPLIAMLLVAGLALPMPRAVAADSGSALEYKVKAGYLYNFARFVEWPASAFPSPSSPFIIGVIDGGEALPVLEKLFAGKEVAGHPVQVKAIPASTPMNDAHILLVTRAGGKTPEEIRTALGSAPTLLVGETDQFAERGGSIAFVHEDDSVRLTLCLEHAADSGLKISAKLSSVAKSVKATLRK